MNFNFNEWFVIRPCIDNVLNSNTTVTPGVIYVEPVEYNPDCLAPLLLHGGYRPVGWNWDSHPSFHSSRLCCLTSSNSPENKVTPSSNHPFLPPSLPLFILPLLPVQRFVMVYIVSLPSFLLWRWHHFCVRWHHRSDFIRLPLNLCIRQALSASVSYWMPFYVIYLFQVLIGGESVFVKKKAESFQVFFFFLVLQKK